MNTKKKYVYYTCLSLMILVTVIMVTSIFPACFPDDSANILNDIYHHDRWRDWHPVTYYLFLRVCMSVYHNPYSVILVHALIAILVHYSVFRYLYKYYDIKAVIIYSIAIFTIGFSGFEYTIILFKDTPFAFGMLGFTTAMLIAIREKWKLTYTVIVISWGVFASMMRHGGWVPLTVGLLCIAAYYLIKKNKSYMIRAFIAGAMICIIFNTMRYTLIKQFEVEKNPAYVTYTIPLYMLGSYTEHEGGKDTRIISVMEELAPLSEWDERYHEDIYFADPIARNSVIIDGVDKEGMHAKLIKANAIYFITEPVEYLAHFFTINNLVWNPVTCGQSYIALMPSLGSGKHISNQFPEWETRIRGLGPVIQKILDKIKTNPLARDIVYRGGLNLIIILLVSIKLIIDKKKIYAMAYIPIILSICMLLISIPQQDSRYVLPQTMVSCLALTQLFSSKFFKVKG